jgi:transcriptional regulator with XRE-family HTH domain
MDTFVSKVNTILELFVGIGERLKEERVRLGMNQADFAAAGGAHRKSQGNYESGERQPDAAYLSAIAATGADIQYIVTGNRQRNGGMGESAVHQAVLEAVELLSLEKKVDARQLANAVVKLGIRNSEWAKLAVPPLASASANSKDGKTPTQDRRVSQKINAPVSGGVAGGNIIRNQRKK